MFKAPGVAIHVAYAVCKFLHVRTVLTSRQTALNVAIVTAAAVVIAPRAAAALRRLILGPCTAQDFSLACSCGRVEATVHAPAPVHLICHCDDCRAFVLWASKQGDAPLGERQLLEVGGGVRTCQVFKSVITVQRGGELLKTTRLTPELVPKDRPFLLVRVYATCCGAPLFNTWPELPSCSFFASSVQADGGSGAAAVASRPQWRLNTAWALPVNSLPPPAGSKGFSPLFVMRFIARNLYFRSRSNAPLQLPPADACAIWTRE